MSPGKINCRDPPREGKGSIILQPLAQSCAEELSVQRHVVKSRDCNIMMDECRKRAVRGMSQLESRKRKYERTIGNPALLSWIIHGLSRDCQVANRGLFVIRVLIQVLIARLIFD